MDFVRPIEAIVPGAQGRVLAVLAETTAELNLRTVARLAGISQAQASRVLPDLVALGVVERREVPPASLFRLVPEHVATRALLVLDIDVVVVRPADIDEDDEGWATSIEGWRGDVRRLTGNPVELLEVSVDDAGAKASGRNELWADIRRDGRVVHGLGLQQLRRQRSA